MFLTLLFFVLGLTFGSFFTALSWRYPRGVSVNRGRSLCPGCDHKIEWYHNIPLFSYIFLGGRCAYCKKKISLRYPLIELATGLGYAYIWSMGGAFLATIYLLLVFSILVLVFVIDFEHQIIPDSLVFIGLSVVLIYLLYTDSRMLFASILSGFVAATFLLVINFVTKGRGMGLGDVKFALFGGTFLGLNNIPIWMFTAFLTGGLVGIILILFGSARMKDKIAFGPFLIVGIIITHFWGEKLMSLFIP